MQNRQRSKHAKNIKIGTNELAWNYKQVKQQYAWKRLKRRYKWPRARNATDRLEGHWQRCR